MLVVSFYTPDYAEHAAKLRESCVAFKLPHWIEEADELGTWVANCSAKSRFVAKALRASGESILWLDADAEIRRCIHHLDAELRYADFAIHRTDHSNPKWAFRSGTMYWAQTGPALELADRWVEACAANPKKYDQQCLYEVWSEFGKPLATELLDLTYCKVFDEKGTGDPHIVHNQASRSLRSKAGVERVKA